jgi:hypothetical protein
MVFLPNLNELQSLEEFAGENIVLLMDNCSSHVGEEVLSLLRDARVRAITLAPHTTHIFQELDLCLFGVLKRRGQYLLPFDDDQTTTNFLLKIYRTFRQTMIKLNIWGAFQETGLGFSTSSEPYLIRFREEKLRSTPGFQEIWSLDFPLEKLSPIRQNAKFGLINRLEQTPLTSENSEITERMLRYRDHVKSQKVADSRNGLNILIQLWHAKILSF